VGITGLLFQCLFQRGLRGCVPALVEFGDALSGGVLGEEQCRE
jgi:hypothetical protein